MKNLKDKKLNEIECAKILYMTLQQLVDSDFALVSLEYNRTTPYRENFDIPKNQFSKCS